LTSQTRGKSSNCEEDTILLPSGNSARKVTPRRWPSNRRTRPNRRAALSVRKGVPPEQRGDPGLRGHPAQVNLEGAAVHVQGDDLALVNKQHAT
jgi:hypothetical protein